MKGLEAKRAVMTGTMRLKGSRGEVFPLLCPTREYDWIEGWGCDLIYSESGFAEDGCVFMTDFPGYPERETWVVSRYEPMKAIEFVKVVPGVKTTKFEILLSDGDGGTTEALWRQTVTGLSETGNQWIEDHFEREFRQRVSVLETMLNHYLSTGEKLIGFVSGNTNISSKG